MWLVFISKSKLQCDLWKKKELDVKRIISSYISEESEAFAIQILNINITPLIDF